MNKVQQQARIQAHRTADITNDDQGAWLVLDFTPGEFKEFRTILEVAAHDTAHIGV